MEKETLEKGIGYYMNKVYSGYFDVKVRKNRIYTEFFVNDIDSHIYEITIYLDKEELIHQNKDWSDIKFTITQLLKMMGIKNFEVNLRFIQN